MCVQRVGGGGGGSRRTTCSGQLAPSTIWIPGTELRPQAWQETPFPAELAQWSSRACSEVRSHGNYGRKELWPTSFFFFFKLKHWLQIERQTIRKIRVGNMDNDTIVTQSTRRNESEHKAKQSPLNMKGQTGKGHRQCDGEETNLANTCAGKCSPS